jgi:antitoxin component of RelBE/YafQ-DinJ toxin-antitoxin module
MKSQGSRRLLTFRLDQEQRQRLRARLAREGRTMSEVVTNGLRQYVLARGDHPPQTPPAHGGAIRPPIPPRLPERVAARLRELRSSGRSELLSGTLAALTEAGWPLRSLAEALGVSRQAVQARVRRLARAGPRDLRDPLRDPAVPCEPPPPFPQRRVASASGLRPHLTIKIDNTLRASAHRAAADEGSSLTQVVEAILDRYLRHGMADGNQAPEAASRAAGGTASRAASRAAARTASRSR